ncbi:uncharacterized protein FIBRA_07806 [Fibroporia radiculosa]|uniref:SET domain-containing protein n=1 Tax=Fibroporia radiculosa TaxID=599839 RepID=J4H4U1_9APHY|nr:uncharacterized protein FIBRA_07806 [Fibroporia radiculosa]CCM05579.1 predicted protein [Fibroporia radiculosa]
MSSRTSAIFTLASVTVLGGLVAYAVYFDYKRRNDTEFRKQLKKDRKRVTKQTAQTQEPSDGATIEELRAALARVRSEDVPASAEAKEQYFMAQVGMGEQLCAQGPMFHMPAALSFYRALRVYPSPVELIAIYQSTVPPPVFKIVMELTNLDVSTPSSPPERSARTHSEASEEDETSPVRTGPPSETSSQEWDRLTDPGSQTPAVKARVEGYYEAFPPKSMNVSVLPAPSDPTKVRKVLVVTRNFEAGDVIYKEQPVVAVLDADLQGKEAYCSHCLRHIQKGMAIRPDQDRLGSVYCSKDCQVKAKVESQNLLFGLEPVLPAELDKGMSLLTRPQRDAAQAKYAAHLKSGGRSVPLLAARFVAKQVVIETAKMMPVKTGPLADELTAASASEYSLYDHLERLRFVEGKANEEGTSLLCDVLGAALPGLEKSLTEERHAVYQGKMAYNAIGVCYSGGRDDKPTPTERPEDQEHTRTPYGTSRQIGSGLYLVSSYIAHSCDPSARPSFSSGTSELTLIATRPLKEGDEITMAYVDISQHTEETPVEARRRRRVELARGWRFKCECSRCVSETADGHESDVGIEKDESKVEEVVTRVETGSGAETFLQDPA